MGLASALTTALTGLTAAETTIDVVGNNVANSNTVGFKASDAKFATQFLATRSLGSGPSADRGGTNPRQTGLGTQVAEITPDFTQGTIEISSSASDLAIQGDGFFVVQGAQGERFFTRNGVFKTNAQNELVTISGQRLLGFGVDDSFSIQPTSLQPLVIPLGSAAVAQATQNVFMEGTLTPTGDVATTAEIITTNVLGDDSTDAPTTPPAPSISVKPTAITGNTVTAAAGSLSAGTYRYKVVFVDANGFESTPADHLEVTGVAANDQVNLTGIPTDASGVYTGRRIYRTLVNPTDSSDYFLAGTIADNTTTVLADGAADGTINVTANKLDQTRLTGSYSYYVTFYDTGGTPESRPVRTLNPTIVNDGRIVLENLPAIPSGSTYNGYRLYRNIATDPNRFYLVDTLTSGETQYVDSKSDAEIQNLVGGVPTGPEVNLDGPPILPSTKLVDVLLRDGNDYNHVFEIGTLTFTGRKGGRTLDGRSLEITSDTVVQDLADFMADALGIQTPPGPDSENVIPLDSSGSAPGGEIATDGRLRLIGNNGVDNAISVGLAGLQLTTTTGTRQVDLAFASSQRAVGQSAVADFVVYDSLGIPLDVRVTAVLEAREGNATTYRWFADSGDNDPAATSNDFARISVGTGLIRFDGEGNVLDVTNATVSIDRRNVASVSPLEFELDFSQMTGLAAPSSTLAASRQDGSAPGTLSSFIIGEDGVISGVFSNGVSRDLGQIRLARFANPVGLEQQGQNLFSAGVNSGLPIEGNPGEQGIGNVVAGAIELSNTDVGANLIDLILASTQYRGNTRVITAAQQLLDELLNLRR